MDTLQAIRTCRMMPDKMKAVLGVPHRWDLIGLLGLGYPEGSGAPEGYNTADPKLWQRKPLEQLAFCEWYNCRKGEAPPAEKAALLQQYLNL